MSIQKDLILCGDNVSLLRGFPDECIDLTVTSPPYDDMSEDFIPVPKNGLRKYNGYTWDFKSLASELYRVTKPGGVVVWVVNDPTIDGSESLASSLQKIYFRRVGFNILDTMIYKRVGGGASGSNLSYWQGFEYMIVLSRGFPKTVNRLKDKQNKYSGVSIYKSIGGRSPKYAKKSKDKYTVQELGIRDNVWEIGSHRSDRTKHPAPFPEDLARDHILTWSEAGDVILDPFIGSGTTAKKAKELGRHYIGIDSSSEYCKLSEKRIAAANPPLFILNPK